ncbi:hypothetical protein ACQ4PT_044154 [Festuca glaucescens]
MGESTSTCSGNSVIGVGGPAVGVHATHGEDSVTDPRDEADRAVVSGLEEKYAYDLLCRHRVGKAPPERPQNSARVTALEQTLREFPARSSGEVIVPEVGVTFDSVGEAYDFYNLYSWERGFGVRYGKSPAECRPGEVHAGNCMRVFGEGPGQLTRTPPVAFAPALIRLLRSKDNGWYICEHRDTHNS